MQVSICFSLSTGSQCDWHLMWPTQCSKHWLGAWSKALSQEFGVKSVEPLSRWLAMQTQELLVTVFSILLTKTLNAGLGRHKHEGVSESTGGAASGIRSILSWRPAHPLVGFKRKPYCLIVNIHFLQPNHSGTCNLIFWTNSPGLLRDSESNLERPQGILHDIWVSASVHQNSKISLLRFVF